MKEWERERERDLLLGRGREGQATDKSGCLYGGGSSGDGVTKHSITVG